jgi:hypothetical protein
MIAVSFSKSSDRNCGSYAEAGPVESVASGVLSRTIPYTPP